jgi:hypothetical protein
MTCAAKRRSLAAAHDPLEDVDAPLKRLRLNGAALEQGWPPSAAQFGAPPPPQQQQHAQPALPEQLRESFPDLIEEQDEEEKDGSGADDGSMGEGEGDDSGSGSASSDDARSGGRRRRRRRGFRVLLPGGAGALPPLPGLPARGGAGGGAGGFRVEELLLAPEPTPAYHSLALVPYVPRGVPAAPRVEEVEEGEEDADEGMVLDAPAPAREASGDMDLD